jgi:hypothetical protein
MLEEERMPKSYTDGDAAMSQFIQLRRMSAQN